ncbi:hypothetical protein HK101_000586 [Irineochytrium annulatum]|nr:hypothetical protein HK101_000586 [Irineochytrium annulatum]
MWAFFAFAHFNDVKPGTYIPYFRIRLGFPARSIASWQFSCMVTDRPYYDISSALGGIELTRVEKLGRKLPVGFGGVITRPWVTVKLDPITVDPMEDGVTIAWLATDYIMTSLLLDTAKLGSSGAPLEADDPSTPLSPSSLARLQQLRLELRAHDALMARADAELRDGMQRIERRLGEGDAEDVEAARKALEDIRVREREDEARRIEELEAEIEKGRRDSERRRRERIENALGGGSVTGSGRASPSLNEPTGPTGPGLPRVRSDASIVSSGSTSERRRGLPHVPSDGSLASSASTAGAGTRYMAPTLLSSSRRGSTSDLVSVGADAEGQAGNGETEVELAKFMEERRNKRLSRQGRQEEIDGRRRSWIVSPTEAAGAEHPAVTQAVEKAKAEAAKDGEKAKVETGKDIEQKKTQGIEEGEVVVGLVAKLKAQRESSPNKDSAVSLPQKPTNNERLPFRGPHARVASTTSPTVAAAQVTLKPLSDAPRPRPLTAKSVPLPSADASTNPTPDSPRTTSSSVRDLIAKALKRDDDAKRVVVASPSNSTDALNIDFASPTASPTKSFRSLSGSLGSLASLALTPGMPPRRPTREGITLFRVKGRRRLYFTPVTVGDINSGDVFILECPHAVSTRLIVWVGSESGRVKKAKGLEVANRLREREWKSRQPREPGVDAGHAAA